jgi:hypothetical protein
MNYLSKNNSLYLLLLSYELSDPSYITWAMESKKSGKLSWSEVGKLLKSVAARNPSVVINAMANNTTGNMYVHKKIVILQSLV